MMESDNMMESHHKSYDGKSSFFPNKNYAISSYDAVSQTKTINYA